MAELDEQALLEGAERKIKRTFELCGAEGGFLSISLDHDSGIGNYTVFIKKNGYSDWLAWGHTKVVYLEPDWRTQAEVLEISRTSISNNDTIELLSLATEIYLQSDATVGFDIDINNKSENSYYLKIPKIKCEYDYHSNISWFN